jgi:hypothetical protein
MKVMISIVNLNPWAFTQRTLLAMVIVCSGKSFLTLLEIYINQKSNLGTDLFRINIMVRIQITRKYVEKFASI